MIVAAAASGAMARASLAGWALNPGEDGSPRITETPTSEGDRDRDPPDADPEPVVGAGADWDRPSAGRSLITLKELPFVAAVYRRPGLSPPSRPPAARRECGLRQPVCATVNPNCRTHAPPTRTAEAA